MAIKELSNVQIKSGSDWYKLCPFPVGYIYMGYTSTSPATTYGGTWSSISGGKYFRAAAANNAQGSNYIQIENMPSHSHQWKGWNWFQTALDSGDKALIVGTEIVGSTAAVGGGQSVLSNISKRICLETYCIAFGKKVA